jgi:hypothetical protein
VDYAVVVMSPGRHLAFNSVLLISIALLGCDRRATQGQSAPATSAPSMSAPSRLTSAAAGPWQKLLVLGRVFLDPDTPETCDQGERPYVIVTDGASDASLLSLAGSAGCRELGDNLPDAGAGPFPGLPVCCPPGLPKAPTLATGGGKSCARALIDNVATGNPASPPAAAPPAANLLNNGAFLEHCSIPPTTGVVLCVASVQGQAQGVSVALVPHDPRLAQCVASRIRTFILPTTPTVQVTVTRFQPEPP